MITASDDEHATASTAAKPKATGQAPPSIARNAAIAGESRIGSDARFSKISDSSNSPIPISARPMPAACGFACRRST